MGNQHVLRHVQPMRAQTAVDGVAAMIGREGDQRVVSRPTLVRLRA